MSAFASAPGGSIGVPSGPSTEIGPSTRTRGDSAGAVCTARAYPRGRRRPGGGTGVVDRACLGWVRGDDMRTRVKAVLALAGVLMLAGCAVPGIGGSGGTSGSGSTDGTSEGTARGGREQVSCAGSASVTLEGRDLRYDVVGDCAEVIVRGDDLDVRMAASTALSIEGRDNDVESSAELGAVEIKGDENDVEARTIASISIAGDGNDLEADTVGSVEIAGNDNGVEAGNDPQPVRVSGNGNTVERR